ncbi:DUF928 domain-containing protein [Kamptonema formosum]|uniref:DUF928 domain-containing protein n=1 Tax=Kamptonema formosum TaxID=331992 RepID=UPI00034B8708|nr:DUF928 domain-containing protein [Oscillatoria sp. PCC 10802]
MVGQKFSVSLTRFSVALSLGFAVSAGMLSPAIAQSSPATPAQSTSSRGSVSVTFEPPKDSKPDSTVGGASRGEPCPQEVSSARGCLTPLMPQSKDGLTVSERPTFLVYIPPNSANEIFFRLVGESNNYRYQTKIPVTSAGGIVSIKLPESEPALEVGKNYKWTLIATGAEGIRPDSPGVQGDIRRIEPSPELQTQLEKVTPLERAALYGKAGIWFDTVGTLAELKRAQPGDATLIDAWKQLLGSVGLEAVAATPLLP